MLYRGLLRTTVKSNEGFRVKQVYPRGEVLYDEGSNRTWLAADELIDGTVDVGLPPEPKWTTPEGQVPLTEADTVRVMTNVKRAFEFLGWTVSSG
jgi:hypothetical protein